MKIGALVVPKSECIFLTPENTIVAYDFETWIEWNADQLGIVVGKDEDGLCLIIATPSGNGLCFSDEINEIIYDR